MVERLGGYKVIAVGVCSKCYTLNVLWVMVVGVCVCARTHAQTATLALHTPTVTLALQGGIIAMMPSNIVPALGAASTPNNETLNP